ncbi:PDZ domain-containing protein [Tepidibacillus marianensis]|uniref:YlbL family protein n=1 Tax=Tepidibacillus marianensis TaxID=3131995 RepID=UPI0030CE251B
MNDSSKKKQILIKMKRIQWIVPILLITAYLSFYIPIPYFIAAPGIAVKLKPIITVDRGYKEKGDFMLTTISMGQGNLGYYLYSHFLPNIEYIPNGSVLNKDEDPEQYEKRQLLVMKQSQDDAIIAAFRQTKTSIEIKQKGILVAGVIKGMSAEKILKVGDVITQVDHQSIQRLEDFFAVIDKKKVGDSISIDFLREGKNIEQKIHLVSLNSEGETKQRVGLGFYPNEEREVIPSKKVTFHTEDIGGPSAGFMFTIEIMNQLLPFDLTRGYQIAGTGTINPDGQIGQIGGANLKAHAASKAGAEIFLFQKILIQMIRTKKRLKVKIENWINL